MCGGDLEINGTSTVAECIYCGTQQTLPKLDDDRKANLYDRANHFRRNNDFDKAMGIYEQILNTDTTDAEAYWSLVLCHYGIEYVEDPATHKRVPTVNRAQFTSIFDDANYKSALEYADASQKQIYENEAKAINEIQKGILAISQNEEPFDVFICYKETDANGRRTPDSVLANDLYHQLTQEGFKVFFSRITLEDKLGTAYEPYIFAALNSSKVMVVLGTKPEYFSAVWVKNEWSRYLTLIKSGANKILIPAYKDMDPYDLPEEFSHLQAQDMSKLGFMQDLIRGIKKLTHADEPKTTVVKETVVTSANNTAPLLKRAFMFLEDGNWSSANEYCEKVLDLDPECADAYLGKLMADLKVKKQENLKNCSDPFDKNNNYQKALRFGDNSLKKTLAGYTDSITERNRIKEIDSKYQRALDMFSSAKTSEEYEKAYGIFISINSYKDSAQLAEKAKVNALEVKYNRALSLFESAQTSDEYLKAQRLFEQLGQHKNSAELAEKAKFNAVDVEYKETVALFESAKTSEWYLEAQKRFEQLGQHRDSAELAKKAKFNAVDVKYKEAVAFFESAKTSEEYLEAQRLFEQLGQHRDSAELAEKAKFNAVDVKYKEAVAFFESAKTSDEYLKAQRLFEQLGQHSNSVELAEKARFNAVDVKYNESVMLLKKAKTEASYKNLSARFAELGNHRDSAELSEKCEEAIIRSKESYKIDKAFNIKLFVSAVILIAATVGVTSIICAICGYGTVTTSEGSSSVFAGMILNAFTILLFLMFFTGIPFLVNTIAWAVCLGKSSDKAIRIIAIVVSAIAVFLSLIFFIIVLIMASTEDATRSMAPEVLVCLISNIIWEAFAIALKPKKEIVL